MGPPLKAPTNRGGAIEYLSPVIVTRLALPTPHVNLTVSCEPPEIVASDGSNLHNRYFAGSTEAKAKLDIEVVSNRLGKQDEYVTTWAAKPLEISCLRDNQMQ